MKLLTLSLAALASMAMLTGCASDDPVAANTGDGTITFSVNVPADIATRANDFGNGKQALNLTYAIFDNTGKLIVTNQNNTAKAVNFDPNTLTATFSETLVRGTEYDVVFWAQDNSQTGLYTLTLADNQANLKVDYTKMTASSEAYDAFYAKQSVVGGTAEQNVTLYRPLAQINLGTSDLNEPVLQSKFGNPVAIYTTTTVTNACNTMDLFTGNKSYTDAGGNVATAEPVTLTQKAALPQNEAFPKEPSTYQYMAMGYVLTDMGLSNITFDFYASNDASAVPVNSMTVPNAPIKANYMTNIYGQLLTGSTTYTLTIDPIFNTPDTDIEYPYASISTADQLAAALQNGGTYKVTANVGDIDLTDCNAAKPLQLVLLSQVGTVSVGYTSTYNGSYPEVSVLVGKDVPFPTVTKTATKGTTTMPIAIKNFHLSGVRGTSQKSAGISFDPMTNHKDWITYENVSFSNIEFDGGGLYLTGRNAVSVNGLSVTNCNFVNLPLITGGLGQGITIMLYNPTTLPTGTDITITGNTMSWAAGDRTGVSSNGIELRDVNGKSTISNNKVVNAPYIGIMVTGQGTPTIQNNTVSATTDAVKISGAGVSNNADSNIGNTVIAYNNLTAGENGIRICRAAFSNTPELSIFGNTIAYNTSGKMYDATAGEPAGILIYNQYGIATQQAKLNIYSNRKSGNGSEWLVLKNFAVAAGSNYAAPF